MKDTKLLLVEDDEAAVFGYERYLTNKGYKTKSVFNLRDAQQTIGTEHFDAILLDLTLPDGNAIEWIQDINGNFPNMAVIVITGSNDVPTAVRATKYGADDFLTKPIKMSDLKASIDKCLEIKTLRKQFFIRQRLEKKDQPFFGESPLIQEMLEYSSVAAANDTVVLLNGETGTGKGVIARWIHEHSERKSEAFVELNCSSLKGELLRSELFGHVKGSFTSAIKDREGLVEVADGGTLFLDEIGDMDIEVQAQLLKTIEERSFRRIGENKLRKSDFRLICATNRDLVEATKNGKFRQDLYFRICVFPITVPSLRERREDIAPLAEYLLEGFGYRYLPLGASVKEILEHYMWPGNIRELRNMLERALLLGGGCELNKKHFPGMAFNTAFFNDECEVLSMEELERRHILKVLKKFHGDKNKASNILGISLSSLYRKISKYENTF